MKAHVEVPEGRWLPSRYRYAIFRLMAFLMLRRADPARSSAPGRRYVLIVDRDQNPIESFTLSLFVVIWCSVGLAIAASDYFAIPPPLAAGLFPILLLVMPLIIQAVLYLVAGIMAISRRAGLPLAEPNHRVQTAVFFILMCAAAAIASGSGRPPLVIVGWCWLALLALNGAAALLMRALNSMVAAAEAQLLEAPSEF